MYTEHEYIDFIAEEPMVLFPNSVGVKPFLKWAGGKTQLLSELHMHIPHNFNKYIEPFIGGGAVLFNLQPKKAIINVFQLVCPALPRGTLAKTWQQRQMSAPPCSLNISPVAPQI